MEIVRSKRDIEVSQHAHSPYEEHLEAVIRILRYLKATSRKGRFLVKIGRQELKFILMQIGQVRSLTEDQHSIIALLYRVIWLL